MSVQEPSFEDQIQELFASANEPDPVEPVDPPSEGEDEPPSEGETPDPEGAAGEQPGQDTSDTTPEPQAMPSGSLDSEELEILGRRLGRQEAQSLVDFYDWVRANPQAAHDIDQYLQGTARIVPQGVQQPAPPTGGPGADALGDTEEDDLSEYPEGLKRRLAELDQMKTVVQSYEQDQQTQRFAVAQAAVTRGTENYQTKMGLTDEEIQELSAEAAALNVLQPIAQQRGDMLSAVEETLDIAYWRNPKFREAAFTRMQQQNSETAKRAKKAGSVSGGSGSTPRTTPPPSTPEDRRSRMLAEIQAAMNGDTE